MLPNKSLKKTFRNKFPINKQKNERLRKYINKARSKMLLWTEPVIECLMEAVILAVKFFQTKYGYQVKKVMWKKYEVGNVCGICLEVMTCVSS